MIRVQLDDWSKQEREARDSLDAIFDRAEAEEEAARSQEERQADLEDTVKISISADQAQEKDGVLWRIKGWCIRALARVLALI